MALDSDYYRSKVVAPLNACVSPLLCMIRARKTRSHTIAENNASRPDHEAHMNATASRVCTQPWCTLIGVYAGVRMRECTLCAWVDATHVLISPWAKETARIPTHTEELPQSVHDPSAVCTRWPVNKRTAAFPSNIRFVSSRFTILKDIDFYKVKRF